MPPFVSIVGWCIYFVYSDTNNNSVLGAGKFIVISYNTNN